MNSFSNFDFRFSIAGVSPALGSALTRGGAVAQNVVRPGESKFKTRKSKI